MGPEEIVRLLIVEQGLTLEAADFAADQILVIAQRIIDHEI